MCLESAWYLQASAHGTVGTWLGSTGVSLPVSLPPSRPPPPDCGSLEGRTGFHLSLHVSKPGAWYAFNKCLMNECFCDPHKWNSMSKQKYLLFSLTVRPQLWSAWAHKHGVNTERRTKTRGSEGMPVFLPPGTFPKWQTCDSFHSPHVKILRDMLILTCSTYPEFFCMVFTAVVSDGSICI